MGETAPKMVRYEEVRDGRIAIITLDRPEARNAQNKQMTYELNDAFTRGAHTDSVKCIVLAAEGPHFSAGHDLKGPGVCLSAAPGRAWRVPADLPTVEQPGAPVHLGSVLRDKKIVLLADQDRLAAAVLEVCRGVVMPSGNNNAAAAEDTAGAAAGSSGVATVVPAFRKAGDAPLGLSHRPGDGNIVVVLIGTVPAVG